VGPTKSRYQDADFAGAGRTRHSVRAVVYLQPGGAHEVTRPTAIKLTKRDGEKMDARSVSLSPAKRGEGRRLTFTAIGSIPKYLFCILKILRPLNLMAV
jgi:hypothetical protein